MKNLENEFVYYENSDTNSWEYTEKGISRNLEETWADERHATQILSQIPQIANQ